MNLIPNPMTVVYRSGVFPGVSPDYLLVAYTYADGTTITYTYTPDNFPLRTTYPSGRAAPSAPPTSFTYTPDGGPSSDGTWSYAYDAEDQLTSVTSSSLTNGAIRVLNTYDYRHRRTSKTVQRLNVNKK